MKKVIADKKKSEALPLGVKAAARDIETENRLTDYQNQISKLQDENKLLKQRLVVSHQQAQQMRKSSTMYEDISSKIDTVTLIFRRFISFRFSFCFLFFRLRVIRNDFRQL